MKWITRFTMTIPMLLLPPPRLGPKGSWKIGGQALSKKVPLTVLNSRNRARYTFAPGGSATPPGGKISGMSRRATPIRMSAIP
jgi:hypothetical protein